MPKRKSPIAPPHEPEVEAALQCSEARAKQAVRYSAALAEEICRRLCEGESLAKVCESDGMPHKRTVFRWVQEDVQGFRDSFQRACEVRAHFWAEELLDLADSATNENWGPVRLQIDTRKWLASKFYPRVFGDRIAHQQLDAEGNPTDPVAINVVQVAIQRLDSDELAEFARLLEKIGATLTGQERRQIEGKGGMLLDGSVAEEGERGDHAR